jgi:hypothetical protein
MALGQQTEPQQTQGQANEPQTTAPAKGKKMKAPEQPGKPQTKPEAGKPETSSDVRGQTNVKGRAPDVNRTETDVNRNQPGPRSSTRETNVNQTTTVNKQEFKSRHSEVFSLGRHPKEFFVQRFGANHFRLIGNSYFVFVDNCWVAVDVEGFVYTERVICPGDPDYIVID